MSFEQAVGSSVALIVPPSGTISARMLDADSSVLDQRVDVTLQLLDDGGGPMHCDAWANWLLHAMAKPARRI